MDSIISLTELCNFHVNISTHMLAFSIALLFFLYIESDHEKGERASLSNLASFPGFPTPGHKYVYTGRSWSFFSELFRTERQRFIRCSSNYALNTQYVGYSLLIS